MLRRARTATAVPAVLLAGLAMVFVALHVHGYTKLSPIDELQHIDYLYRAPSPPAPADRVRQEALRQQDCRGVDAPGFGPGPCRPFGTLDPTTFQEKGYNTAAANSPFYYTVTRGAAEVVEAVTPADDLVTAGRLVGGLWFALGLVLTFVAGRRRGVPAAPMTVVSLLLVATPALIFPSATITPDASGLAAGAALVFALTWWEERPGPARSILLTVVGLFVSFAKMTNLVGVAAVAIYILLRPSDDNAAEPPRDVRARMVTAAAVGLTSVLAAGAWMAFVSSRAQIPADDLPDMATRFATPTFPWTGLVESSLNLLQPINSSWAAVGSASLAGFSTSVAALLLLAGTLAAALFAGASLRERDLARSVVAAALAGALALVTVGYLSSGTYFPLPARYGIVLVAPMAVVTASVLRSRSSVAFAAGAALLAISATAFRLATLA